MTEIRISGIYEFVHKATLPIQEARLSRRGNHIFDKCLYELSENKSFKIHPNTMCTLISKGEFLKNNIICYLFKNNSSNYLFICNEEDINNYFSITTNTPILSNVTTKYPHTCGYCGSPAYIGLNSVDCSNKCPQSSN